MATELRGAATTLRRLTVDEVIRMSDAGIIGAGERVELVDGWLVAMSPEGADHAAVTRRLVTRLARLYPEGFEVGSQSTLPLGEHAFLEPDVYVVRPTDPARRWPRADEVVLVVEVARTSARRDRIQKAALYAAWGAEVYWVIDLTCDEVVVHTGPGPDGYRDVRTLAAGRLELPASDETITVAQVLAA